MRTPPSTHEEALPRLRRIAGQIQGVQRMVTEKKYCIDIITQIQAVRSALRSIELRILQKHMAHCVGKALESGSPPEAEKKMAELLRVLKKQY